MVWPPDAGLHPSDISGMSWCRFYLAQTKAPHYSDEKLQEQLMMQVMSNGFAVPDMELGMTLGVGLYPMGALLNHSPRYTPQPSTYWMRAQ